MKVWEESVGKGVGESGGRQYGKKGTGVGGGTTESLCVGADNTGTRRHTDQPFWG